MYLAFCHLDAITRLYLFLQMSGFVLVLNDLLKVIIILRELLLFLLFILILFFPVLFFILRRGLFSSSCLVKWVVFVVLGVYLSLYHYLLGSIEGWLRILVLVFLCVSRCSCCLWDCKKYETLVTRLSFTCLSSKELEPEQHLTCNINLESRSN